MFLLSFLFNLILFQPPVFADEISFEVAVDREHITLDESVSLQFKVFAEGSQAAYRVGEPEFHAPDFQAINSYESPSLQNFYINGQFSSRYSNEIVVTLKPKKVGTFKIENLAIEIGGKKYTAPAISVEVSQAGQGTPPPQGYGGLGGLRGTGKQSDNNPFLVRSEVSKSEIFKGEQIIVSYYLYSSSSISDFQIQKYPVLDQFFREDLEIPALNRRGLQWEQVNLDGITYSRALLAQYAAYPLATGELGIDSMSVKASYIVKKSGRGNNVFDDPFFGNFFAQTKVDTQSSQAIKIKVNPLPLEGRPKDFKDVVGQFEMSSALDRTNAKVGEGLNFVINIQGRGNVSAIEAPALNLSEELRLFESNGKAKSGRGGSGQKVFEYLIIPKKPGNLKIPQVSFSYFDPTDKKYKTHKTEEIPIVIEASDNALGDQDKPRPTSSPLSENQDHKKVSAPALKEQYVEGGALPPREVKIKKWISYLGFVSVGIVFLSLFFFLLLRALEYFKQNQLKKNKIPFRFNALKKEFTYLKNKKNKKEFLAFLLKFQTFLIDATEYYCECEEQLQAYPRSEWPRLLLETQKLSKEDFMFLEKNFDYIEKLIFSGEKKLTVDSDFVNVGVMLKDIEKFLDKYTVLKEIQK